MEGILDFSQGPVSKTFCSTEGFYLSHFFPMLPALPESEACFFGATCRRGEVVQRRAHRSGLRRSSLSPGVSNLWLSRKLGNPTGKPIEVGNIDDLSFGGHSAFLRRYDPICNHIKTTTILGEFIIHPLLHLT